MVVLKAVTILVAGLLTALAVTKVMGELQAAKARARVRPSSTNRPAVRLRQDPRTGVYYPET
jgi:uncharacterized protein (DUF3084 family)